MELQGEDWGLFDAYLGPFAGLIGDRRSGVTFGEIVKGIIQAGSLVCQRIAAHSAVLSAVQDGAQRVIRFAKGKSTKRSEMNAEHLTEVLQQRGVEQLAGAEVDELRLIGDGLDLRKQYAREMPTLMQVRDLDGSLVPGYRTLSVLGVTPQRRGVLYQRLFSSQEVDLVNRLRSSRCSRRSVQR